MGVKNKKEEQYRAREEHRERQRKARRKRVSLGRKAPQLEVKPTILIVCEGENTEPSYFKQFRLSTATIKAIGEGYNTTSLIKRASKLAEEGEYDQVWCVFDKDDFDDSSFNNAISMAVDRGYHTAYSNQAFEYWIILHFDDHQGGKMHRKDYNNKINSLISPLSVSYDGKGNKRISKELFELLDGVDKKTGKERKLLAIERAKRNIEVHSAVSSAQAESSTTLYLLVETILKYR